MPDRRTFLRTIVGGIATAAAVRSFPFRVYSFPSDVATPVTGDWATVYYERALGIYSTNPLYGIKAIMEDDHVGHFLGLSRASYPAKLSARISTE